VSIEWDPVKAAANARKHRVTFDEAQTVLGNPLSITGSDPDHSYEESRYLAVGPSKVGRILVVAFTDRGSAVRLISARRATRRERRSYEEAQ
jgi:hypothetical protein